MGVKWFFSQQGTMALIWSDKGTNFIGAEKEFFLIFRKMEPVQHCQGICI